MNKTIEILKHALERSPEDWETRRHLAELLLEQGAHGDAQDILAAAPEVPEIEADELFLAEQLSGVQPAKAASFIDRALRRNEGSAPAHWLKAQVFQALGSTEDAGKHYARAAALDDAYAPTSLETGLGKGSPARPEIGEASGGSDDPLEREAELVSQPELMADSNDETGVPAAPTGAELQPAQRPEMEEEASQGREIALEPEQAPRAAALRSHAWSPFKSAQRMEATQEMTKNKNRVIAVFAAGMAHALLILLCLTWYLTAGSQREEPDFIMTVEPKDQQREQLVKRTVSPNVPQRPSSSSASRAKVIAASVTSSLAVPQVEFPEVTDELFGDGDSFGQGSGFGEGPGSGGGPVRFFGLEKTARRVCYIVDFSYSMLKTNLEGEKRIALLKRELIKSISKLSPNTRYTVVFFSSMPWLQNEKPDKRKVLGRQGLQDITLDVTWYDASKKNRKKTEDFINGMALAGPTGTWWMSGFRPAMKIHPKPDVIYLLTDGICQDYIHMGNANWGDFIEEFINNTEAWEQFREEMLALVPKGASLNTVAMEVGGVVALRLAELAEKTGGDFSIVYEGKTYTGKSANKFKKKDYNPLPF